MHQQSELRVHCAVSFERLMGFHSWREERTRWTAADHSAFSRLAECNWLLRYDPKTSKAVAKAGRFREYIFLMKLSFLAQTQNI